MGSTTEYLRGREVYSEKKRFGPTTKNCNFRKQIIDFEKIKIIELFNII